MSQVEEALLSPSPSLRSLHYQSRLMQLLSCVDAAALFPAQVELYLAAQVVLLQAVLVAWYQAVPVVWYQAVPVA